MVEDRHLDRGRAVVVGHALRVDQFPGALGVDRAHGHVARRDRGDGPGEAPAVAVEHRQRPQIHRLSGQAGVDDLAERVQVGAAVGVLHPLGPAGGAGGVVDRDRLLLVLQPARRPLRRRTGQHLLVRIAGVAGVRAADHGDAGQLQRRGQRLQAGIEQQVAGAAVLEDVADLGAGQAVVDRDQDPARGRHAEMGLQHRRRVEQQRSDPVTLAQPRRPQRVGQPPGALRELSVGVPPSAAGDRDLVRVQVGRPVQEVHRVQLRAEYLGRCHLTRGRHREPQRKRRSSPASVVVVARCSGRGHQDTRVHDPGGV